MEGTSPVIEELIEGLIRKHSALGLFTDFWTMAGLDKEVKDLEKIHLDEDIPKKIGYMYTFFSAAQGKSHTRDLDGYFLPTGLLSKLGWSDELVRRQTERGVAVPATILTTIRLGTENYDQTYTHDFFEDVLATELMFCNPTPEAEMVVRHSLDQLKEKVKTDVQHEITKEMIIEAYMEHYLPYFRDAATLVDAAYFDLKNLVLDEPMVTGLKKHTKKLTTEYGPYFRYESKGLMAILTDPGAQKLLKTEKHRYLKRRQRERESRLYAPLALSLYLMAIHDPSVPDRDYSLTEVIHSLVLQEFKDHAKNHDFKKYVERIEKKEDILSIVEPKIDTISKATTDEVAVGAYLCLFTSEERRYRITEFTSKEFIELWTNAFTFGWGDQLYESIDAVNDLKKSQIKDVASQKSGGLVHLLMDSKFKESYKKGSINYKNFSRLEQLREMDQGAFHSAFPLLERDDDPFVSTLIRLVANNPNGGMRITAHTKEFVTSMKNPDDSHVLHLLKSPELAEKAARIYHNQPSIMGIDGKEGFLQWFYDERETLPQDIDAIEAVQPYMAGSKSKILRETLAQVYKKHGSSFTETYLPGLEELGILPYLRSARFFAELETLEDFLRKRENLYSLKYSAFTLDDTNWNRLVSELLRNPEGNLRGIWGNTYTEKDVTVKQHGTTLIGLYSKVKGTPNEGLYDRILDLGCKNTEIVQGIAGYVEQGQVATANQLVSLLEHNLSTDDALGFLSLYKNDADLEACPPEELFALEPPKKRIQEQPKKPDVEPPYDPKECHDYIQNKGYSPELVETILIGGFQLKGPGRFIGECYLPAVNVRSTAHGKAKDKHIVDTQFGDTVEFLIKEGVLIYHKKKGRGPTDGCLSVNPRVKELDEPFREYMRQLLY